MRSTFLGIIVIVLVTATISMGANQELENDLYASADLKDYIPDFLNWDSDDTDQGCELSFLEVSNITSSSAVITWVSRESCEGRIRYGLTDDLDIEVEGSSGFIHSMRLKDLPSGTRIYYQAYSGDEKSEAKHFNTSAVGAGIPKVVYGGLPQSNEGEVRPVESDLIIKLKLYGSGNSSQTISVKMSPSHMWMLNLGNLKTEDGQVFAYDDVMTAKIRIEGINNDGEPEVLYTYKVKLSDAPDGNLSMKDTNLSNLDGVSSSWVVKERELPTIKSQQISPEREFLQSLLSKGKDSRLQNRKGHGHPHIIPGWRGGSKMGISKQPEPSPVPNRINLRGTEVLKELVKLRQENPEAASFFPDVARHFPKLRQKLTMDITSVDLYEGINIIGLPLEPDTTITSYGFLGTVTGAQVITAWDGELQQFGETALRVDENIVGVDFSFELGYAYFVTMNTTGQVSFEGMPLVWGKYVTIYSGLDVVSLVGHPDSTTSYSLLTDMFDGDEVCCIDTESQTFKCAFRIGGNVFGDNFLLEEGSGFFVQRSELGSFPTDDIPPSLTITEPSDGSAIYSTQPFIEIIFGDHEVGLVLDSLSIMVNGVDRTSFFTIDSLGATLQMSGGQVLPESLNVIEASIYDLNYNEKNTSSTFNVVTTPPAEDEHFVNGYVYDGETWEPMEGVAVDVESVPGIIFTDSDGHYVFPTPGLGEYSIKFTKQHYIESKKSLSILEGHGDVFVDNAYLSIKDSVITRITYQGGVAINSDGSVEISFPQEIVDDDINARITNFNDPEDLPAELPGDAAFTYCTDVEPYGKTLSDSAFVDQLNNRGFAPGTPIPLGSYNKQTFEWESEGLGNISPDGNTLEFGMTEIAPICASLPVIAKPGAPSVDSSLLEYCTIRSQGDRSRLDPVDLSSWTQIKLDFGGHSPANWVLTNNNTIALETVNAAPSFYLNNQYLSEYSIDCIFGVDSLADDDFIGFTFGWQDSSHYYIFDWKQANQGNGNEGFSIKRISAPSVTYLSEDDFWNSSGTAYSTILATNFGVGKGWVDFVIYDFHLDFQDGNFTIIVSEGDTELWNVTVYDGSYTSGQFGFYTFSQGYQHYSAYDPDALAQGKLNFPHCRVGCVSNGSPSIGNVGLKFGGATVDHSLPAIKSMGMNRSLNLVYTSNSVSPNVVIESGSAGVPSEFPLPEYTGSQSDIAGMRFGALIEASRDTTRQRIRYNGKGSDGKYLPTRLHYHDNDLDNYSVSQYALADSLGGPPLDSTGIWTDYPVGFDVSVIGDLMIDNHISSEYGSGWVLSGLQRVHSQTDTDAMVTEGGAAAHFYEQVSERFLSRNGDFSFLSINDDSASYSRIYPDSSRVVFDTSGYQIASIDRSSNTTTYEYDEYYNLIAVTYPGSLVTQFDYVDGLLETVTDPAGRITQFDHDEDGNLISIADPDSSFWQYEYDSDHLLTKVIDPRDNETIYEYDSLGYVTRVIGADSTSNDLMPSDGYNTLNEAIDQGYGTPGNPAPAVKTNEIINAFVNTKGDTTYSLTNTYGRKTKKIDVMGREHKFDYNEDGYPTELTRPDSTEVSMNWSEYGKITSYTDESTGATTTYKYDPLYHKPIMVINAYNDTTKYELDTYGNTIKSINAAGHITRYSYDSRGLLTKTINAVGDSTLSYYGATGSLDSTVNELGHVTKYEYDLAGNQTAVIDPLDNRTEYEYDLNGRMILTRDPLGNETEYIYDPSIAGGGCCGSSTNNLLLATINSAGDTTWFDYDEMGRRISTTDPLGNISYTEYDSEGHVTKRIDPEGRWVSYEYDDAGNTTSQSDSLGRTTTFEYDSRNRKISTTDAMGGITRYVYNDVGNLTHLINANSDSTSFDYDILNRKLSETDPLGRTKYFKYNSLGQMDTLITAKGDIITFEYDELSRLEKKQYPVDSLIQQYDAVGNVLQVDDNDSRLVMTYDDNGQVRTISTGDIANPDNLQPVTTIEYLYDDAGKKMAMIDPVPDTTYYYYDVNSQLDSLVGPNEHLFEFEKDKLGRVTKLTRTNGTTTDYQYDNSGQVTNIEHKKGVQTLNSMVYSYNPVGMVQLIFEGAGVSSYTYDSLDQVLTADYTDPQLTDESFTYDSVGNRLISHLSSQYEYDDANQITGDDIYIFTFDDNGNMTVKEDTTNSDRWEYTYDYENRLLNVKKFDAGVPPASMEVNYSYDTQGRRICKAVDSDNIIYIYDGSNILYEYDASESVLAVYIQGPSIDQPFMVTRGEDEYYFHADKLGSIRLITDSTGTVVQTYQYDSFGNIIEAMSEDYFSPYAYTGREWDEESGLYYYRARYYDANSGRFLQTDPMGSLNCVALYTYVNNNSINLIDPSGMQTVDESNRYYAPQLFQGTYWKNRQYFKFQPVPSSGGHIAINIMQLSNTMVYNIFINPVIAKDIIAGREYNKNSWICNIERKDEEDEKDKRWWNSLSKKQKRLYEIQMLDQHDSKRNLRMRAEEDYICPPSGTYGPFSNPIYYWKCN